MTLRLFLTVFTMELRKMLSYRFDFWANAVLSFVLPVALSLFVWKTIYIESGSDVIAGYTFHGMVTYYILVWLCGRVVRVSENPPGISEEIYDGSLTKYILYPTSYFWFKYARHLGGLSVVVLQVLVFGAIAGLTLGSFAELSLAPHVVLMAGATIVVANMLHFVLFWPVESVAFWQDNVWSLNVISRFLGYFLGGILLPLAVFPDAVRGILRWLPFQYLYSFPVRVMMGDVGIAEWLEGTAVAGLWIGAVLLVTRVVWKRGDRQYTGVGI